MGFKIGDIVRRKDGDGRPHKIVDMRVHHPLNSKEHTFFEFIFDDGACAIGDDMLQYYKGDYKQ